MTHDELVSIVAHKITGACGSVCCHRSGGVGGDLSHPNCDCRSAAKEILAAVYTAMIAPNKRMVRAAAKAMSPEKRPTQDWVSAGDKHAYRFMAMIEASPLKPSEQDTP